MEEGGQILCGGTQDFHELGGKELIGEDKELSTDGGGSHHSPTNFKLLCK